MRQVSAHQRFFDPAGGFAISASSRAAGLNQLLLAIGRAVSPPVIHMRSTFQPMRVIVVEPDLVSTIDRAAQWGCETPQLLPHALHPGQNLTQNGSAWRQRIVQGEILSDESGRLYEKLGRHIRPVHQLASGRAGELIEMIPAERNNLRVISPPTGVVDATDRSITTHEKQEPTAGTRDPLPKKFVPIRKSETGADNPGHRKLFTDPGQWRVVTWGEFKEILSTQLAHPDRLRDSYRLPCYVQVVETYREVTIEELANEFSGSDGRPKPLYFLTEELAAKLELTSLLPPLPVGTSTAHRGPNVLLAHQRVFRLLVANDPTVDVGNFKKRSTGSAPVTEQTDSQTKAEQSSPTAVLKTSIPTSYVKEWEFKISREEALYDISSGSVFNAILRLVRRLRVFKQHGEFRKWQVLLTGKNSDEQLWRVRPPTNMLGDPFLRDWVKKTLELAGYDSERMLGEWEIFWRRKGLT
jgi:hypothetical protein